MSTDTPRPYRVGDPVWHQGYQAIVAPSPDDDLRVRVLGDPTARDRRVDPRSGALRRRETPSVARRRLESAVWRSTPRSRRREHSGVRRILVDTDHGSSERVLSLMTDMELMRRMPIGRRRADAARTARALSASVVVLIAVTAVAGPAWIPLGVVAAWGAGVVAWFWRRTPGEP